MIKHAIVALLLVLSAFAQTPVTPEDRKELARTLPHLLETLYVSPERGKELAAQMRAWFASGKYDSAATAPELAELLNADLRSANDRHLNVRYNPQRASNPVLTVEAWTARRAAMDRGPMVRADDRDAMRRVNYGVRAAEVLDGNVGYLKIRGFMDPDGAQAAIASAMAMLANTEAIIVDVRDCPGGSAETVSYLASYFFGPERRVLMNRYNRPMNRSMDSTTVDVAGRRMPDVPVYVLIAPTSASACESFAFTLQQWGRAKTVGEKTAGAGNNNMIVDAGLGLGFSISVGTATHPKSGKRFEAVGVSPDIEAPADRALQVAHAEARGTSTSALSEYAGKYGVREVSVRDGALYYQRTGARGGVLNPLGPDKFDLNGDVVIAFQRSPEGKVTALQIEWKDGRKETVPRD